MIVVDGTGAISPAYREQSNAALHQCIADITALHTSNDWRWNGVRLNSNHVDRVLVGMIRDVARTAHESDNGYFKTTAGRIYAEARRFDTDRYSITIGIQFQVSV